MPLNLLLGENISQLVAGHVRKHQSDIGFESVHTSQQGAFRGRLDRELLLVASAGGLTLVTYDLKTIHPLLVELSAEGQSYASVAFADALTIANDEFGTIMRAFICF